MNAPSTAPQSSITSSTVNSFEIVGSSMLEYMIKIVLVYGGKMNPNESLLGMF